MRREASPAPPRPAMAASRKRTAARFSSTSSARLSMPAQDRLLRATEYGEITRIGASKPISVDVRIVAATNENLPAQVDRGKFRADLLDRLSFEVITLPPLRAREGDIPLLAEHFGRRMSVELEWSNWPGFSPRAMADARSLSAGPAMSASCATSSSAPCTGTKIPSGRSTRSMFNPFHSPWAPAASAVTGSQLRRASGCWRRACGAAAALLPQSGADRRHRFPRRRLGLRARSCSRTRSPQPLQPARDRIRARPQLRPASSRAEAPQAARRRAG